MQQCIECGDFCKYFSVNGDNAKKGSLEIVCNKMGKAILEVDVIYDLIRVLDPSYINLGHCAYCSYWDDAPIRYTANRVAGAPICSECTEMLFDELQSIAEICGFKFDLNQDYAVMYQATDLQGGCNITFAPVAVKGQLYACAEKEYENGYGPGYQIVELSGARLLAEIAMRPTGIFGAPGGVDSLCVLDIETGEKDWL